MKPRQFIEDGRIEYWYLSLTLIQILKTACMIIMIFCAWGEISENEWHYIDLVTQRHKDTIYSFARYLLFFCFHRFSGNSSNYQLHLWMLKKQPGQSMSGQLRQCRAVQQSSSSLLLWFTAQYFQPVLLSGQYSSLALPSMQASSLLRGWCQYTASTDHSVLVQWPAVWPTRWLGIRKIFQTQCQSHRLLLLWSHHV